MAQKKKKSEKLSLPIEEISNNSVIQSGSEGNEDDGNRYFNETKNEWRNKYRKNGKLMDDYYLQKLVHLQEELVKL